MKDEVEEHLDFTCFVGEDGGGGGGVEVYAWARSENRRTGGETRLLSTNFFLTFEKPLC